jgi:predicted hydrocarbon binding protein
VDEKHIMVVRYGPKKRYFLISAKLSEHVGALADFTKILAIRGVNILEGSIHVSDAPEGHVTLFVEGSDPRTDAGFLEQMLSGSSFLESVEVFEGRNGMIVDSASFPLVSDVAGRSILLTTDSLRNLFSHVTEKWGKDAEELIYQLGVDYGSGLWSGTASAPVSDKESLQQYLHVYGAIGMGRVTVEKFRDAVPSVDLSVEGLFECEGPRSPAPRSVFFRGILAGTASSVFGREMAAREVACVAAGAKKCQFEVRPKS